MSRQRDYQPTIDRARSQAEIADRRIAKMRAQKDECHREMLRAQAAARIANEEADALRDRICGLEQSGRDLRRENTLLRIERDANGEKLATLVRDLEELVAWVETPWWRRLAERVRGWFRDMVRIGAEA